MKRLLQLVKIPFFKRSECVRGIVGRARIGAAPLGKGLLLGTRAPQPSLDRVIPLVTPRLLVDPIELVALLPEFPLSSPRSRPRCRIVYGDDVFNRGRANAGPAFDEMQVLAGLDVVRLVAEIGHVDDQRIPLPVTARVQPTEPDRRGKMRAAIQG